MTIDAFKSLDPDMLTKMVKQAEATKESREAAQGSGGGGDFIPTAYLPEGKHTMRILADPELAMYRMVRYFQLSDPFARIADPRFYKNSDGKYIVGDREVPDEYIQSLWERCSQLEYPNGPRTNAIFYGLLIKTDSPSEYWKPGSLYVVLAPGRFESAWMTQIANLAANEDISEHIARSMNPTVEGWGWDLAVVKGTQGSISITPTFMKNHPAIEIGDNYLPLSKQLVTDTFTDADMARIDKYLDEAINGPDNEKVDDSPTPPNNDAPEDAKDEVAESSAGTEVTSEPVEEPTSDKIVDEEPEVEAAEDNFGLSDSELVAAKAAGIKPADFAKMIGKV